MKTALLLLFLLAVATGPGEGWPSGWGVGGTGSLELGALRHREPWDCRVLDEELKTTPHPNSVEPDPSV